MTSATANLLSHPDPSRHQGAAEGHFEAGTGRPRVRWTDARSLARRLGLGGRTAAQAAAHGLAFAGVFLLAHLIRCDGAVPAVVWQAALEALPLVVGVKLTAYLALGCHRGWWRSAGFADLSVLAEAATLGSAALLVADSLTTYGWPLSRSVWLIDWTLSVLALCGARGSARLLRERYGPLLAARRAIRVLVVGGGEASLAVVRQINAGPGFDRKVVGLLDPDTATHGRVICGAPVVGAPDNLARLAARHRAEAVLIPTPATPARQVRSLLADCAAAGLKAQVVPGFDALLSGTLTVEPRDVDIEDLLCRPPVRLDLPVIGRFLEGKVVLVTGASGSIGSEVCRQVLAFRPARLVLVDHAENGLFFLERELRPLARGATEVVVRIASITDARRVQTLFRAEHPQVVFHAAAHKHVPMMEANPGEAVKNNILGTKIIVDEAVRAAAEAFVMVSTDKAVNPTSVMGVCKRVAETYVQSLAGHSATRLVTVRFGNVLGSAGSVVPIFREQIRRGGPVTVTHPGMTRYFMTIPEASQLILQAGAQGRGGEIFVLDMGEPVKVVDLARDLIRLSGQTEGRDVDIQFTGLRPGEKLYEELYDQGEDLIPTAHPRIRAARSRPYPPERLRAGLDRLARVADGPSADVLALLQELMPSYRPGGAGSPTHTAGQPASESRPRPSQGHALHHRNEPPPEAKPLFPSAALS